MNIALINKQTNICENVAVFDSMETAENMLGSTYNLTEAQEGYGIGDIYKGGKWSKAEPTPTEHEPTIEEDLMALAIDTEYRVTLLELGIQEV